jgi:hypothetical protein
VYGQETEAPFPEFVNHPVQDGPVLKGMMVYLMDGQLLLSEGSIELLDEVFGASVSEGTVFNSRSSASRRWSRFQMPLPPTYSRALWSLLMKPGCGSMASGGGYMWPARMG